MLSDGSRGAADARDLLDIAVEAAQRAGDVLLGHFRRPVRGVETKSTPTDLVSDADREAETLLLRLLSARRPGDGFVAEEGAGVRSRTALTWILDPLDGTVNFLFGIPEWAVSVAVEDPDGVVAGVVHNPTRGETFTAVRSMGARLNGEPIRVSLQSDPGQALIGTGFSYDARVREMQATILTRVLPRVRDIRRAGSAALDLCSLACGRLDGFYEAPMERWDRAAGELLVTEAGGVVSDLAAPHGLSTGVVAGNPELHDRLRDLVVEPHAPRGGPHRPA